MSRQEPEVVVTTPITPLISQFVNRQRELALIRHEYEVASSGCIRVVMLVGELGVGKTRLLNEVTRQVESDGAMVLRGDASDAEGMPPYLPFLEALGQYIHVTDLDRLREQVAVAPQALLSFLPELSGRLGELPVPYPLPERGRLHLFEAVGAFLNVISKAGTLVLMLDDLHWADAAGFDLLCYVTKHQPKARILMIGTYRDGEISRLPALERAMIELTRQRVLTTITVNPLPAGEIEALANSYLQGPVSAGVSALLHKQSEGNPFFAEEILRVWVEMGMLIQENKRWVAAVPLEPMLPQSILGALRQRFARLSTASIDHLRVASIVGRTFDLQLLASVEGKEVEAVEEHLLEAVHAGLIKADGKGGFSFTHDKIRESLYIEVSTSRRRRLHETIGRILEAFYKQNDPANTYLQAELAYHFTRSGDQVRGAIYAQRAAEQAMRSSALEEAIGHYQTALQLLASDNEKRVSLLLGLGEAAMLAGMEGEAVEAFTEALAHLSHLDQSQAARASHGLGLVHWRRGELQEARASLLRALELLNNAEKIEIVPVLADFATLQALMPDWQDEGQTHAQQALEMARMLANKRLEAIAMRAVIGKLYVPGNEVLSSVETMKQALEPALTDDDCAEVANYSFYLAVGHYIVADMRYAYQMSLRRVEAIEGYQRPCELRGMYSWLALLYASQGAWSEAEQAIEQEQSLVERRPSVLSVAFLHQMHGFLAYQREDYATAEREFQAAEVDRQGDLHPFVAITNLLGLVQATSGKRKHAKTQLVQLETLLAKLPTGTVPTAPLLVCLALMAMALGDEARVKQLYPLLLPFRGQQYWFLVDRVLGKIALLCGDWEDALMHLEAAEETARREELHPELARTLVVRAELDAMRNDQESNEPAQACLKQALDLFDELGMSDSAGYVRNQLRALANRAQRLAPRTLPADLTEREARVLQLVAQGKSNRQIARTLGLSEKTVANHLSHIFSKIGSENRASATAFAIRHGLA